MSAKHFEAASALCKRYAENLAELPNGRDVALECAAILEDAAKLPESFTDYDIRKEIFGPDRF